MHYYNFVQDLAIHTRFDDFDLTSRSQVRQNHKLQIVFRVLWYFVATHIEKIKHSLLCVTGVYLRDITNTFFVILHLNVNHLCIFCSC